MAQIQQPWRWLDFKQISVGCKVSFLQTLEHLLFQDQLVIPFGQLIFSLVSLILPTTMGMWIRQEQCLIMILLLLLLLLLILLDSCSSR